VDALRGFTLSLGVAGMLMAPAMAPAQSMPPTDIVAVDNFIDAARIVFGRTRAQVEHALGSPSEVRARTLADGVSPLEAVDELIYPGVSIFVSRRSAAVRRVILSQARSTLPQGLTVDAPRRAVERVLGEPQSSSDTSVMYLYADGFPNTVEFHFRDGRVQRIEWTFAAND